MLLPSAVVRRCLLAALACGGLLTVGPEGVSAEESKTSGWSRAKSPSEGPARSIGSPGAGCMQGASRLPLKATGYRVMRPERHRVFGHPRLIAFIQGLSKRAVESGLAPVGVGDLGQPRGGPAPSGHASHQNGLDVDLWFTAASPGAEAEDVVDEKAPTAHWSDRVAKLLELTASDVHVDRIFVGPVIKRELCEQVKGDRSWLRKVRPWWGHRAHFHTRLACPEDSPQCTPQPPLPAGDGCDEVQWWLSDDTEQDRARGASDYGKRVGGAPELPKACAKLIE